MLKIAIIGAGISGLTLANNLQNHAKVTIFDKARGPGGRMSTRRVNLNSSEDCFSFDHGTQFFSVKSTKFKNFLQPLIDQEIVQNWNGTFIEINGTEVTKTSDQMHHIGVPKMNAIPKHLAHNLDLNCNVRISKLSRVNSKWTLTDENNVNLGEFDWVISTIPPKQAEDLIPRSFKYFDIICQTKMLGCFSLMLAFEDPFKLNFDSALVKNHDISRISVNSNKPLRGDIFTLMVNGTNDWSERHLEADKDWVMQHLCNVTSQVIRNDTSNAFHKSLHMWRYANIEKQPQNPPLIDLSQNLAVCGDWCISGEVESGFLSAYQISEEIIRKITNI